MTFSIRATHNGRHTWLTQGDKLSIEFPDGKGVEARIADVSIAPGGTPFSIICTDDGEWPDARPEFAPGEVKDDAGSDDLTEGEQELLNELLRTTKRELDKQNDRHRVLSRRNELQAQTIRELQSTLGSRTRQLERSRRHHDEKNERLAELEKALEKRHRDVEDLRASLKDLGADRQLVVESAEASMREVIRERDSARAEVELLRAEKQKKAGTVNRLPGSTIHQFVNGPSTQQVLAARERLRQRVVTQHDEDGSVTIRIELSEPH